MACDAQSTRRASSASSAASTSGLPPAYRALSPLGRERQRPNRRTRWPQVSDLAVFRVPTAVLMKRGAHVVVAPDELDPRISSYRRCVFLGPFGDRVALENHFVDEAELAPVKPDVLFRDGFRVFFDPIEEDDDVGARDRVGVFAFPVLGNRAFLCRGGGWRRAEDRQRTQRREHSDDEAATRHARQFSESGA
jgi:hypothetical protein